MKGEVINNYTGTSEVNQDYSEKTRVYCHPDHPPYWIPSHARPRIYIGLLLLINQSFLIGNVLGYEENMAELDYCTHHVSELDSEETS